MTIGEHVFANYDLTCISAGEITLEDGVMLGPNVSLLTVNHDFEDLQVIICHPITIRRGAWTGVNSVILPGITVGAGAVVGSGSVVTHDVPPNTVVAGNPRETNENTGAENDGIIFCAHTISSAVYQFNLFKRPKSKME